MPALLPRFTIDQPSTLAEASELLRGYGEEGCAYAGGVSVGMRRENLQVRSFAGELSPAAARWRAWASLISLAALGIGFAWAGCDAQQLTWHDYMSRTFVTEN